MSDTSGNLTVTLNKKVIVWVLVVIAVVIVAARLVYDYAVKPAADVTVEKTGEAIKKAVELPDELEAKSFGEKAVREAYPNARDFTRVEPESLGTDGQRAFLADLPSDSKIEIYFIFHYYYDKTEGYIAVTKVKSQGWNSVIFY